MKDINIKQELASKVLGRDLKSVYITDGKAFFELKEGNYIVKDLHRFVAMCKDYIFQNYDLTLWTSRRTAKLNTTGVWIEMPRFVSDKGDSTDITAILKATDWVLNAEEWNT